MLLVVPVAALAVGIVVAVTRPEMFLHAGVTVVCVLCLTVLAGLGKVNGDTVAGTVAGLGGLSGIVNGFVGVKTSPPTP